MSVQYNPGKVIVFQIVNRGEEWGWYQAFDLSRINHTWSQLKSQKCRVIESSFYCFQEWSNGLAIGFEQMHLIDMGQF